MSPLLAQALATALRAAELTDGAVDPTVGEAVRNAGYDVDFEAMAADGAPITIDGTPGARMAADPPLPGDAACRDRRRHRGRPRCNRQGACVRPRCRRSARGNRRPAGCSSASAVTSRSPVTPPYEGWHIQIAEDSRAPITPDGETIAIRAGGVATSSTTVRRWRRGGVELHHIIDPATGLPAIGPWRTVSVVAGSCVDANIAATAAIVRGVSGHCVARAGRASGAACRSQRRR